MFSRGADRVGGREDDVLVFYKVFLEVGLVFVLLV